MGKAQEDVSMFGKRKQEVRKAVRWRIAGIALGALVIVGMAGPQPAGPDPDRLRPIPVRTDLVALEDSIRRAEIALPIKPDNEARIIWHTPHVKTPYAMVYLHGNGASQEEGDPIHEALAARYGCNLFLPRLAGHGLEGDDPMMDLTADAWVQSALDAIMVGKALGEKVILVSCSTGSTLALYLAARYPDLVDGHILLSPNIDMRDPRAFLLSGPWGLQFARAVRLGKYYEWEAPLAAHPYWYTRYRLEGLTVLKTMIDAMMVDETFAAVDDPVLLTYYFRDDKHQDDIVSVHRMREMYAAFGTPVSLKRDIALPDANTHIIASDMFNQNLEPLWTVLVQFCEEVLQLTPVNDTDFRPYLDTRG